MLSRTLRGPVLFLALSLSLLAGARTALAAPPVITNIVMVPSLTIESDLGVTNQIQFSTVLDTNDWQVLTNLLVLESPYRFFDVTAPPARQRFYRVFQTSTNLAGPAVSLAVEGFPSPQAAGVIGDFTVTARDASGRVATGYRGTIRFASTDPAAMLPGDYTFTAGDAGTHTFPATFRTAGTRGITATDTAAPGINGSQGGILVRSAAASTLVVAGYPSPQTAGVSGNFTVTARDAFGNVDAGYTGTIVFSSNDGAATLPVLTAFTAGDAGVKSFSATLRTAGARAITATDTATAAITGTQAGIFVNPAAAATLVVVGFPSPQSAGVTGSFVVTARDAFGNTASGYTGTIAFTSNDGAAILPANTAFTAGDAGVKAFTATLRTAESRAITATDTVAGAITGTQGNIVVTPGAATSLVVAGFPSPQIAGVAGTFVVTARDAFGNVATGYLGTVAFTSTDPAVTLPANTAFTAGDAGVKAFTATLRTAGTRAITATDTVVGTLTGTQGNIVVTPAAAAVLVVAGLPSPRTAGTAGGFIVTARDAFGNTATGYLGTIAFTSTDAAATLPANTAFTAGDAGVKAFTATLRTAGTRAITATDTVVAALPGTQSGIVVNAGPAATLVVTRFPSPQKAGTAGLFTVVARDAFGNTATGYLGTVTFSSSDPLATLPGNTAFTGPDAGLVSFSATLRTVGIQSITAKDLANAAITGTQSGISVTP